jgi:hypothetical protein
MVGLVGWWGPDGAACWWTPPPLASPDLFPASSQLFPPSPNPPHPSLCTCPYLKLYNTPSNPHCDPPCHSKSVRQLRTPGRWSPRRVSLVLRHEPQPPGIRGACARGVTGARRSGSFVCSLEQSGLDAAAVAKITKLMTSLESDAPYSGQQR